MKGENKMITYQIKEKYQDLERKLKEKITEKVKPIQFVIGPDRFVYPLETKFSDFDKRYYGR